jgi:very-short-patch-repair endonuclease
MILSNVSNLGKYSKTLISVICDSCSVEKSIVYKLYTSYGYSNGEYLCKKCKTKKNNIEKYSVENVFQIKEIKEKIKNTNLTKWGVENISQSNNIKEKVKQSKSLLDKEVVNNKRINTNLSKYGVDNVSKIEDIKVKKIKSNISKFGVKHNKKSESFRKQYFKIANNNNYIKYKDKGISIFKCDIKDHLFEIDIEIYSKRIKYKTTLCTICNPIDKNQSGKEIAIYNFIKSIYSGEVIQNYKIDRKEIDIYIPDYKIGFEFNGVYWHSELYKEKDYHLNKTNFFLSKGIRIIHIWEDEWDLKSHIIKSQISNLLNLNKNKIWARKCVVKPITNINIIKDFLNNNHIQGYVNSIIKLGLYHDEQLVSIMIFDHFEGRKKMSNNEWSLSRFCTKLNYNVAGGASKLLSYFIKEYNPIRIVSYADASWSVGSLYEKLNFKKIKISKQDYKYILNGKRIHKSNFKKTIININENELSIPKIWDCGKIKYELILTKFSHISL